jgi:hypothetical protein
MWELIKRIKPGSQAPWLMIGDFNESMWQFEHLSATKRSERKMLDFREVLSHYDLHDLGFSGTPWMNDNKQNGERNVKVHLDRVVASPQWSIWFPNAMVKHIVTSRSDHCPILLSLEAQEPQGRSQGVARYEIMWEREASLSEEINKSWEASGPIHDLRDFVKSLKRVMVNLKSWSHTKFGVVTKELSNIRKRMEELEFQGPPGHTQELHTLRSRMDELLYREEKMWLQHSRVAWLKEGDKNTSYFHRKATGRAKKSKIRLLRKEDMQITKDKAEMKGMAREFFRQLYSAN